MFENLQKTIKDAFSRKTLNSLDGILPFKMGAYKNRWDGSNYLEAYEISLYANKCIEKRAEKVSEIDFKLMKGEVEIKNNKLMEVLYKPNKIQSGREFWGLFQKYKDIFGEVYILIDGDISITGDKRVNAMHLLRPDKVKPFFSEQTGEITKVEYQTASGTSTYQSNQIVYHNRPNPRNPLRGVSLLAAGVRSIETGVQIDEYHAKILQNGGRVEGIFKFKNKQLTQTQLDALKDQYDNQYAEAQNSGRPLFLGGEGDYENIGLSPSELSYLETKKVTLEDILIMTGVPKAILGSFDDIKFDNADAAVRIFLRETIRPLLQDITTKLDSFLFPSDLDLSFVDPTPENIEQELKEVESGIKNYYMTPNEARKKRGLDPLKGGDEILIPFNLAPGLQSVAEKQPIDVKAKVIDTNHPLKDYDNRRAYEKLAIKRLDRQERQMKREVDTYFKNQMNRIIDSVSPEQKYAFKKKDLVSEVFNQQIEVAIAKETFFPLLETLLEEAGVNARAIVGPEFNFQMTANAKSWLDNKTAIFAEQINSTTFEKLKTEFETSFEIGETRKELVERIEDTYGNITKARAQTIAATEVHGVTQYGTLDAYKQAGLPTKIWVSVGDGKVRPSHQSIDGQEVELNGYFSNGLNFPGDPSGSAAETINCRCVI